MPSKAKNPKPTTQQSGPAAGQADASPPQETSAAETLRNLYASLLCCRRVQERLAQGSESAAERFDVRTGHEAVSVGATANLVPEDTVAASSRNLSALVARGIPIRSLVAGFGASCSPAPLLPEDPFHAGAGCALAHKLERKRHVVVAFCAQQNPSLDDWQEALRFAAGERLPIIFVIENDPASAAARNGHLEPVSFQVRGHNLPGIVVDGSDVVAVWRVAQEAVHRARNGWGATLIDCRADAARDPLAHMEHYLRKRHAWDDAWSSGLEMQIAAAIQKELENAGGDETPIQTARPRGTLAPIASALRANMALSKDSR
ncbi:MAG TPA: thiamine pyrophosphate-dependent enzyme [Terriglobales bacterium]|nr:thiamine pyrophosphate-dependent enzyme [Terriglobales bacterium]